MAYATTCDVFSRVFTLIKPSACFSSATCPTYNDVVTWLSSGCSVINARLAGMGYGAIPATSGAYDLAAAANSLYAAWQAERSRITDRVSTQERTRADQFKKDFEWHLSMLLELDLSRAGVSQVSTAYAGGISVNDKATVAADTDRVPGRFSRGMFSNTEALRPYSSGS